MKAPSLLAVILLIGTAILDSAPARRVSYEPPLPGLSSVNQLNLLSGAKATASGHWDKQTPDRAINGDKSPADHWACENLPVWHQVDLGAAKSVGAIRVWPYWGDGRVYQYKVEGSTDGQDWTLLGDKTANSITGTTEGDAFSFAPREVRYLRTTFLKNSRGSVSGGHIVEIEAYAEAPMAGLSGGIGTTDTRYPPAGAIELKPASEGISLTAWRGERVSAQIVVSAAANQSNLRAEPATLQNGAHRIPVEANFIRYTLADGKPQGDILDTETLLPLVAGQNRPVWLTINVPGDVPAGVYSGTVTVRSDDGAVVFPISLEVLAARLPAPADWKCHLDLWQHPQAVARWHDVPAWSPEHFALLKPQMQRLADAGQKTITCTLIEEAWGGQTYDAFPAMVRWTKKADGSWAYDYAIFDRWVSFMTDEVGLKNARIHCYTMIPWSLKFRFYDEAAKRDIDLLLNPGSAEYDAFWGRFLKDFTAHLRAKGWLERARIGMDERPDALMRDAIATLQRHAPELRIASAINHPSVLTRDVDDVSPIIQTSGEFSASDLKVRRDAGRKTTFYVCTSPAVPNTFTFSPPAEAEWLGLFAAARGFDGFLRWAYQSWVENPLRSTDFTSWPSGDCFLIYPGNRSSVRFERLRDGIEDFEKLHLLRTWAAGASQNSNQTAALAKLENVLKDFIWERGSKPGIHADDVRRATDAINAAARALGPTQGARNP